jgi:hypothetical protein
MDLKARRMRNIYAIREIVGILENNSLTIVCRKLDDKYTICFVEDVEKTPKEISDTFVAQLNTQDVEKDFNTVMNYLKGE